MISVAHLPAGNYWISLKNTIANNHQKLSIIH
jgi:hypothetical protein